MCSSIFTYLGLTAKYASIWEKAAEMYCKCKILSCKMLRLIKVTVYSLLMNYSYETFFAIGLKVYCWHKFQ